MVLSQERREYFVEREENDTFLPIFLIAALAGCQAAGGSEAQGQALSAPSPAVSAVSTPEPTPTPKPTPTPIPAITQAQLEQGTIDPEADIGQYWNTTVYNPYYPDIPITINTLITHTSSLTDAGGLAALKGTAARQRLAGSGYQSVRPGAPAGWSYNNYGFAVLGMTLELAADQPLDQVLGEGMLQPMGIDAAFEAGSVEHTELLASLYQGGYISRSVSEMLGYVCNPTPGYRGNFFAGGFTCSAGDYARLIAVLANDGLYEGQALLSEEAVAYMESPLEEPITDEERGITFLQCRPLRYQEDMYGREGLYYHTGSAYGFYGLLSYDPETRDGLVVFTTGVVGSLDDYGVYAVCGEIAQAVYDPASRT